MFEALRNSGIKSAIYGVVLVGIVGAFILNFGPSAGGAKAKTLTEAFNEACAVKVGSVCIDPKAHKGVYRLFMATGDLTPEAARGQHLSQLVAEGEIERELFIREAERLGVTVSKDELTDSIAGGNIYASVPVEQDGSRLGIVAGRAYTRRMMMERLPWFFDGKTKEYDYKVYDRTVKGLGQSTTEFREWQERELLAYKVRELIQAPVRVSESEAFERYVEEKSTATAQYIDLKQSLVERYLPEPTQAELDAWAKDEANKKKIDEAFDKDKVIFRPNTGHIRHILVKLPKGASPVTRKAKAERIAEAWARIKAGETFGSVAKGYSEDGSAQTGGDVGDKTDGFVAPFRKAADALKAGEVTDGAIESDFGFHIIAKDDPSKVAVFETQLRKDTTRRTYLHEKLVPERTKEIATKMIAALKAGKSDDDAVKEGLAILSPKVLGPSIKIHVLEAEGATALPTTTSGDAGAPQVADAGPSKAAKGALKDVGKDAGKVEEYTQAELANDSDKPGMITSAAFNKSGDPIETLSGEASTKLSSFAFSGKPGDVLDAPLDTDTGLIMTRLKDRHTASREEFDKDRETFTAGMLAQKRKEAISLYMKRLRDRTKDEIKIFLENMVDAQPKKTADGGVPLANDPSGEDDGN